MLDQDRQKLKNLDRINRLWREKWEEIAEPLKQEDCEYLIRGLVITERELEWSGGSVSGAIWVFRVYERRFSPSQFNTTYFSYGPARGEVFREEVQAYIPMNILPRIIQPISEVHWD